MTDASSSSPAAPERAVVVGVVPGQPARVVAEAARQAALHGVALVVGHVDVTRFVTFEDPDGLVHTAAIDISAAAGEAQTERVRAEVDAALSGRGAAWSIRPLVGDPATALARLADTVDAPLIVVGTRRRGIGESIREFFSGSVAARLAHRQTRPVLVVPLGDGLADDEDLVWD